MLKVKFLGTCSGTEPFENMHHCSWILETETKNYWFDAGENCAHRAYCDGIDVMKTAALFISHPHFDHTGGLVNLMALFCKMESHYKKTLINNNTLEVFTPSFEIFKAARTIVCSGNKDGSYPFEEKLHTISDGEIYNDENITVKALHNGHLKEDGSNGWHSFSFSIKADGKHIIYSGDVKSLSELDSLLENGADMLIMETGHHKVQDVLEYALSKNVKKLRFNHHGRQIINNRAECEQICKDFADKTGLDVIICYDGMKETLK